MDIVSFQIYCIEFYSGHSHIPSNHAYTLFKQSGLLQELETDYEDLHGLGTEALMQYCDLYLGKGMQS